MPIQEFSKEGVRYYTNITWKNTLGQNRHPAPRKSAGDRLHVTIQDPGGGTQHGAHYP